MTAADRRAWARALEIVAHRERAVLEALAASDRDLRR
jgi:hypothetical protein